VLSPRQVIPAGLVEYLQTSYGRHRVVDAQELYFRVKYEKSEIEMRLIADACVIADAMLRAMLAVLRPGRLETEVAAWGAWVGRMLGSERLGGCSLSGMISRLASADHNEQLNDENLNHENPDHENLNHDENLNYASPVKKAPVSDRKLEANRRTPRNPPGP
jgi:hypothetical protein